MNRYQQTGVTLVEMMVTVIVAGVLAGIAVPSFVNMVAENRRTAEANDYFIGFQFARSEAIKRNSIVSICASANGSTCITTGKWESGYIVFNNPNQNTTVDGGSETVLRVHPGVSNSGTTVRTATTAIRTAVHFSAAGFPQDAAGAPASGVYAMCDTDGLTEARGIELAPSGRTHVTRDTSKIGSCP